MQQSLLHSPASDQPVEHLAGSVARVTFHSEESGFCVLRIKVRGHRDLATVVGTAASITAGEYIECDGWWVTDRTHGLQFKTHHLHVVPPTTLEGIEKYLASGMVKGIGPHFAKKLVAAFGEQVFDVIEYEPGRSWTWRASAPNESSAWARRGPSSVTRGWVRHPLIPCVLCETGLARTRGTLGALSGKHDHIPQPEGCEDE